MVGRLQPILAQLPRTISAAVLSGSGREDAARARVVDTLEQQTREAEGQGFDIDAVTESDLAMPARTPSPVTMEDLDRIIGSSDLMPPGTDVPASNGAGSYPAAGRSNTLTVRSKTQTLSC